MGYLRDDCFLLGNFFFISIEPSKFFPKKHTVEILFSWNIVPRCLSPFCIYIFQPGKTVFSHRKGKYFASNVRFVTVSRINMKLCSSRGIGYMNRINYSVTPARRMEFFFEYKKVTGYFWTMVQSSYHSLDACSYFNASREVISFRGRIVSLHLLRNSCLGSLLVVFHLRCESLADAVDRGSLRGLLHLQEMSRFRDIKVSQNDTCGMPV